MRIRIVDPPAYTPPYDRSLCAALARAGAEVELVTSRFPHGSVPAPDGYQVREGFYRRSTRHPSASRARRATRAAEHPGDMLRFRRQPSPAELDHYQWLTFPRLDRWMLPPRRPRVLTAHGWLRAEAWALRPARGLRRLFAGMDAVVTLSEYGAERLREGMGMGPERVRVIPHGAFDYLTRIADESPLPADLASVEGPVVLFFGLLRPYKGVDVLLEAFREVDGAELWIVGRPFGVDLGELTRLAAACRGSVRLVPRFVDDREIPALFRRADLVVLPHRDAEQSGVLFTALAFGKPIVISAVGGFPEIAELGAARLVPPSDPGALATAITELLARPRERERLAAAASAAATGPYSWDSIAEAHLTLYRELRGR